jgi:hypothetical protein
MMEQTEVRMRCLEMAVSQANSNGGATFEMVAELADSFVRYVNRPALPKPLPPQAMR